MKKIVSGVLATALSASFVAASLLPAEAAPAYVPQTQNMSSNVQAIDYKPWMKKRHGNRDFGNRDFSRRDFVRRDMRRSDNNEYWNGHRGSRHWRNGYRRHGDLWFPLAAFATGAIITGAIVNDRPRSYGGNAHVQWCYDHYRSYRASDDTFQPNYGPRKLCNSPY